MKRRSADYKRRSARIESRPRGGLNRLSGHAVGFWSVAVLLVFALGLGIGFLGGLGVSVFSESGTTANAPIARLEDEPAKPTTGDDAGEASYSLPVVIRKSERARRDYLATYEEDLRDAPPPPKEDTPPVRMRTASPEPAEARPKAVSPATDEAVSGEREPSRTEQPIRKRTWLARATPVDLDPAKPVLAVVIDDVGVDVKRSRRAVRLPGPLTMAFLPYGYDLGTMVDTARSNGHDILVHLPMEPLSREADPGPHAMLSDLPKIELAERLDWNLSRFGHFIGLNNHMGSKFSADEEGMRLVMQALSDRGLMFLDSITTRDTRGYSLAREMGVPYAVRDVFIDHTLEAEAIQGQLKEALEIAKRQGYAIAIGHPHDETLDALRRWLPTLEREGVQLAPISEVVKRRYGEG